jgi:hypothetical protein
MATLEHILAVIQTLALATLGDVTLPKVAKASNTTFTKECMVAVTLLYVATIAKPTLATLGDVTQNSQS